MTHPRRKALTLAFFTVGYNLLEGVVSIVVAISAGSTALLGFGLDSFVESLSGCVVVWRFWNYDLTADDEEVSAAEKKATRLVAWSFFVLGTYVLLDACLALYRREQPDSMVLGIVIAVASLVVMPVLFWMKFRLGQAIGSSSLVADAKETLACVALSVALLLGLGIHHIWKLWWVDPAAAIVIAILILCEGFGTLKEV